MKAIGDVSRKRPRAMSNEDIGDVLFEVAELIDIQNGNRYRANAFRKAGRLIGALREPADELLKFSRLQQKPGIGKGTVERVKAILRTGTFDELERLRAQVPAGLRQLTQLKGIGPKTAKAIWVQLRISTVEELEQALLTGRLDAIAGIGPRTKEKIVDAIRFSREDMGRLLLPEALAIGARMVDELRSLSAVLRIHQCGSARRRKATIGDLDILVGADDKRAVATRFCMLPGVVDVMLRGEGRCSVRIEQAVQVDLRVVAPDTFGAGMHYFTGSQQHNIRVRTKANAKGWSINEHGIFIRAPGKIAFGGGGASDQRVAWGRDEADIFGAVGLQSVPPELRENEGEIEEAERHRLPTLVEERQLQGDLHVRAGPALPAVLTALKGRGRRWAVVVHPRLECEHDVTAFTKELKRCERETGMRLAPGAEVSIAPDGSVPPRPKGVSWVVAQIPEADVVPGTDVTERLLSAVNSGAIDALARPTGRMLLAHKGHRLDWEQLLRAMARARVVLEVRAHPVALDPDASTIRRALELGVLLSVTAAPLTPPETGDIVSGVFEARRGWARQQDVLECARLEAALQHSTAVPALGASTAPQGPLTELDRAVAAVLAGQSASPQLAHRAQAFLTGALDLELEDALLRARPDSPALAAAFELVSGHPALEPASTPASPPSEEPEQTQAPRKSVLDDFDAFAEDPSSEKEEAESHAARSTTSPASEIQDEDHGEEQDVPQLSRAEAKALVETAVGGGEVDSRLRAVLEAYLRGKPASEVEVALKTHGENPLQLAFELVMR